jgi:DNA-directed RNA polymerase specialized sigma24 family protein
VKGRPEETRRGWGRLSGGTRPPATASSADSRRRDSGPLLRPPDEPALPSALARLFEGDDDAGKVFWGLLFRFREEVLRRFPGRSRRRWFDPEDAFSEVTLEITQEARDGRLTAPSAGNDWIGFLCRRMRRRIWERRRRDVRAAAADDARQTLSAAESPDSDAPGVALEVRDELDLLVPQVKALLSPKQEAVFFAAAQEADVDEVVRLARTTPGAARVHLSKAEKKLDRVLRPGIKVRAAS